MNKIVPGSAFDLAGFQGQLVKQMEKAQIDNQRGRAGAKAAREAGHGWGNGTFTGMSKRADEQLVQYRIKKPSRI